MCRSEISDSISSRSGEIPSRASASTSFGIPSRSAIASAFDCPGRPMWSLNVGASDSASNSTEALLIPSVECANAFSSPWCVVATVRQPIRSRYVRIDCASAEPSTGSVPAASSSSSTSERCVDARRIEMMLPMCELNVDSDCSIDCSSPMSANTASKTGRRLSFSAGTGIPACAINASRPTVLMATVLPPVFGPVIKSTENASPDDASRDVGPPSPSHILTGTTSPVSCGCRAFCR